MTLGIHRQDEYRRRYSLNTPPLHIESIIKIQEVYDAFNKNTRLVVDSEVNQLPVWVRIVTETMGSLTHVVVVLRASAR